MTLFMLLKTNWGREKLTKCTKFLNLHKCGCTYLNRGFLYSAKINKSRDNYPINIFG